MNIKHILSLPPDKRDLEIRKLIVPKPWRHDWVNDYDRSWNDGRLYKCSKCKVPCNKGLHENPCLIPDPTVLDWNLAKQEQAMCEYKAFTAALDTVYKATKYYDGYPMAWWAAMFAEPTDIVLAALKAKESK